MSLGELIFSHIDAQLCRLIPCPGAHDLETLLGCPTEHDIVLLLFLLALKPPARFLIVGWKYNIQIVVANIFSTRVLYNLTELINTTVVRYIRENV